MKRCCELQSRGHFLNDISRFNIKVQLPKFKRWGHFCNLKHLCQQFRYQQNNIRLPRTFSDCGFSAHAKCSEKLPADCCPDLKNLRGVFGIDLTTLVKAHHTSRPFVVDKCVREIEVRGLRTEGLYRVSGFADEMDSLRLALDRGSLLFL